MFNRQTAKEKSKTLLRTRTIYDYLGFALLLMAYLTLLVMPIVNWFAAIFFNVGMIRAALRMNRGDNNVRVADIALAGDRLARGITISLWKILLISLWNIPSFVLVGIGILLMNNIRGFEIMIIFCICACVWGIFITIYKNLQYYFAEYVAEDKRDLSGLECVSESSNLMIGHIKDLFSLKLSNLGWKIIAVVIPINAWFTPYEYLTYASVYEQLKNNFVAAPKGEMVWYTNGSSIKVNENVKVSENPVIEKPNRAVHGNHALEVISGEYVGTSFPITDGEEIRIGRDTKRANIVVQMGVTSISGLHCSIRYNSVSNSYFITDFSTNGTYLDGRRLQKEITVSAAPSSIIKLAEGTMIIRLV